MSCGQSIINVIRLMLKALKASLDAQPQNEILRLWGLGGYPQQAAPEAEWLSRGIACYNEFDPEKTQRNCVAQRLKPKLQ